MMLEEMKRNEQKNGEGIARPTIQELEDSLLFKAGEMTVEDKEEEMRDTYFAFADKLENMMHNTQSTIMGGQAIHQNMDKMQETKTNQLISHTTVRPSFAQIAV